MLLVYEFELVKDQGVFVAFPFDFEGGTQGRSAREASDAASDWLQMTIEHYAMHGLELPDASFGNEACRGGKVIMVASDAGLETVRKMTATEAARMLGVTPGRVTQMHTAGKIEGFKEGRHLWIPKDAVRARLIAAPRAGRPARKSAKR